VGGGGVKLYTVFGVEVSLKDFFSYLRSALRTTDWVGETLLPGPEIAFRPVHQKSSANLGKSSANLGKSSDILEKVRPILEKVRPI
jgi:hypothetical protein